MSESCYRGPTHSRQFQVQSLTTAGKSQNNVGESITNMEIFQIVDQDLFSRHVRTDQPVCCMMCCVMCLLAVVTL
jgi:hypothetical protein